MSSLSAASRGDVTVDDALGRPLVKGAANMTSVQAGHLTFARLTATAKSRSDRRYSIDLKADGDPLSLSALANVDTGGELLQVEVARLKGTASGIAFASTGPFKVTRGDNGELRVTRAELGVGGGRLAVDGRLAPEFDARLVLNDLPLRPFRGAERCRRPCRYAER